MRASAGVEVKSASRMPMATDGVTLLVADLRTVQVERRRGDCVRLAACEMAWIQAHGGEQARCPNRCDGYVREALRVAVFCGANGLVSMSGES